MKILEVNKYYFIKGGCETYMFNLIELLEEKGNEIMSFSMNSEENFHTKYERFYVNEIDYNNQNFFEKIMNSFKIIYSFEAKSKMKALLKMHKPDIVHLHNIYHQLSPSIIHEIKKHNIPIIMTAHDYKIICPNYKLYQNNKVCNECKGQKFYKCTLNKCSKNSLPASLVNTVEMYLHKFLKTYEKIDQIITPSKFLKDKLIEFGYADNKIKHIYNFVDFSKYLPSYRYEDYFVCFGRISEEKGIMTLLKAMKKVKSSKLIIIGSGPSKEEAEALAQKLELNNVEFLGFKTGEELKTLIKNALFVTINSEWYENNPMSVIESMAMAKGIVGARIGGIPELIEENVNGLLYEPGNANELGDKINYMLENKDLAKSFGEESLKKAHANFGKEEHYLNYMNVVNKVMN